jgi:hypothetical protein
MTDEKTYISFSQYQTQDFERGGQKPQANLLVQCFIKYRCHCMKFKWYLELNYIQGLLQMVYYKECDLWLISRYYSGVHLK